LLPNFQGIPTGTFLQSDAAAKKLRKYPHLDKALLWVGIDFNADPNPDPAFYLNADPDPWSQTNTDPDPWSRTNADPDPGQTLKSQKIEFYTQKINL
jgi:hypothetical protein